MAIQEPITRACSYWRWDRAIDVTPFQPDHDHIAALALTLDPIEPERERLIRTFDERDLVGTFVDAGFARVTLEYHEHHIAAARKGPEPVRQYLPASYVEAARVALGEAAPAYLERLGAAPTDLPQATIAAWADLTAWR